MPVDALDLEKLNPWPAHDRLVLNAVPFSIGDVVFSRDWDAMLGPNNEWLVRHGRFKFKKLSMASLPPLHYQFLRPKDSSIVPLIGQYLKQHGDDRRMCELVFQALAAGNLTIFGGVPMMPDTKTRNLSSEFDQQWDSLIAKVEMGDALFLRQTDSRLSNFIADLDHGSWSHVMCCGPNGLCIGQSLNKIELEKINNMRNRNTRLGLYRRHLITADKALKVWEFHLAQYNRRTKYNYVGAIITGLQAKLFINGPHRTPNGLIYTGGFCPIAIA